MANNSQSFFSSVYNDVMLLTFALCTYTGWQRQLGVHTYMRLWQSMTAHLECSTSRQRWSLEHSMRYKCWEVTPVFVHFSYFT